MLNKIYLALFVLALIATTGLTYLTYSQLQSIGFAPATVLQNFDSYSGTHRGFLFVSSLVLLITANAVLWATRRSWAMWLTFLYFAVFLMLNMWWLSDLGFNYQKQNSLSTDSFTLAGIWAAVFVVIAGIGVFFDQFIVLRLRDKMFGQQAKAVDDVPIAEGDKADS